MEVIQINIHPTGQSLFIPLTLFKELKDKNIIWLDEEFWEQEDEAEMWCIDSGPSKKLHMEGLLAHFKRPRSCSKKSLYPKTKKNQRIVSI